VESHVGQQTGAAGPPSNAIPHQLQEGTCPGEEGWEVPSCWPSLDRQLNGVRALLVLIVVFGIATLALWLLLPFRLGRGGADAG
jgi:hypothetical protein